MSAYKGILGEVTERTAKNGKAYWSVIIDTAEKGEVKFLSFDRDLAEAAQELEEGTPILFDANPGKEKDDGTRWPSTLKLIMADRGESPVVHDESPVVHDEPPINAVDVMKTALAHLDAARTRVADGIAAMES